MATNWQLILGEALRAGSRGIRDLREDRLRDQLLAQQEEERRIQRALEERRMQMAEEQLGMQRQAFLANEADKLLEAVGPGAHFAPDDPAVNIIRQGGRGVRLTERPATLESRQFTPDMQLQESPSQPGGFEVVPTFQQRVMMDEQAARERERQRMEAARAAIESPDFLIQPREKRQMLWTMAGYPGQVPETFDEQKRVIDYQHQLEMEKLRTQLAAQHEIAGMRAGGADGGDLNRAEMYANERGARIIDTIDQLLPQINWHTAGAIGGTVRLIPGTPAHNVWAKLQQLGAQIAFRELAEMRAASKTGGALGNVSNVELDLLQNSLGAIRQTQDPEVLRQELQNIRASLIRWAQAKAQYPQEAAQIGAMSTPMTSRESSGVDYGKFILRPKGQ